MPHLHDHIKPWQTPAIDGCVFGIMSMRGGSFAFTTPMLWVIGCIAVVASPGLISFVVAEAYKDRVLHDTYFVVAHWHWVLALAAVFGFFAGWYYLFPKISGYAYSDFLGKVHFWLSFIGFTMMFVPQLVVIAGMAGRMGVLLIGSTAGIWRPRSAALSSRRAFWPS